MLETPVPILQHPDELGLLLDIYRWREPKGVLEVGVGHGGTLFHWLANAVDESVVVAVDDRHVNRHLYDRWVGDRTVLEVVTGNSHDPNISYSTHVDGPYDFVFIDADHHYVDVRADWVTYSEQTTPDAVVAFHDITPNTDPNCQVDGFWKELAASGYDTLELAVEGGYGIGVVFMGGR